MSEEDIEKLDIKIMKKHATLIVNFMCSNPSFTNQEKEKLVSPKPKINLPDDLITQLKKWNLIEKIYERSVKKRPPPNKRRIIDEDFQDAIMLELINLQF